MTSTRTIDVQIADSCTKFDSPWMVAESSLTAYAGANVEAI